VLVEDLLNVIEGLAPAYLAQPWDNSGLEVGDGSAPVGRVLASLELSEEVLGEAVAGEYDVIITHHPVLFSPVRSLVEDRPKERILRRLVENHLNVISCHTNLDAARGGLADIVAEAIGLRDTRPLEPVTTGWVKFIGFIPAEAVDGVAAAVFAAGAGGVGAYSECAYSSSGTGWFTPGVGSSPVVGKVGRAERVEEVRWETVVPKERMAAAVTAFVTAHPYEEPAFDLIPMENDLPAVGLGRVGILQEETRLEALAETLESVFGLDPAVGGAVESRMVRRVAVLPGSGRGSLDKVYGQCDVLITGELSYHDSEEADEHGLALIDVPHGEIEWWAFKQWIGNLSDLVKTDGVQVEVSASWRSPWQRIGEL